MLLGININYLDLKNNLTEFVSVLSKSGANSVTVRLSDDLSDFDENIFNSLKKIEGIKINLKIPLSAGLRETVLKLKPHACYIISETENNRKDYTMNIAGQMAKIISFIGPLFLRGISPVPFISAEFEQIEAAANSGVGFIELNSAPYAESFGKENEQYEFEKLKRAAEFAQKKNLAVTIGQGINYKNVIRILEIDSLYELNIGHEFSERPSVTEACLREIKALID